jgi:hypothetical protein
LASLDDRRQRRANWNQARRDCERQRKGLRPKRPDWATLADQNTMANDNETALVDPPFSGICGGDGILASAPFGIEMGSPISNISVIQDLGHGKYYVSPPKLHPNFSTYIVESSESYGIVWVKAIGPEIFNDSYGSSVQAAVDKVAAQLATRYGIGKKSDISFPDGLWTQESRDWCMALLQGERLYSYVWQRPDATGLPDDLESIYVGAGAIDANTTNLIIEYSSINLDAAERESESGLADLL